jgi:pyrimidine operon attenuation protein/uracil phosphoribosyltransferase
MPSNDPASTAQPLLDQAGVAARIEDIASQIAASHPASKLAFVGIHTRGVTVAQRVQAVLAGRGIDVPLGTLDISFYRDDLDHRVTNPVVQASDITFDIEGLDIIIFDDVLFTGRTIRSALEGLMSFGRPAKVELAVLVDRGNRELPIQPDFVGHEIATERLARIEVKFTEHDDEDSIALIPAP